MVIEMFCVFRIHIAHCKCRMDSGDTQENIMLFGTAVSTDYKVAGCLNIFISEKMIDTKSKGFVWIDMSVFDVTGGSDSMKRGSGAVNHLLKTDIHLL